MQLALSLLLLAAPALLVSAVHLLWRRDAAQARRFIWIIVAAVWAVSGMAWVSYAREDTDVGLMVSGILGGATLVSAVLATITAAVIQWRS